MAYKKQTWSDYDPLKSVSDNAQNGAVFTPDRMNHIERGLSDAETKPFPTVTQMMLATHQVGDIVRTAGFYEPGDGGGAKYEVVNSGSADGILIHELPNGLKAKIVVENGTINVLQAGAKHSFQPGNNNFNIFQKLFDTESIKIIDFVNSNAYVTDANPPDVDGPLFIRRKVELLGRGATLWGKYGLEVVTNMNAQPAISNLKIVNEHGLDMNGMRHGIGLNLYAETTEKDEDGKEIKDSNGNSTIVRDWGASAVLKNVTIDGYHTNLKTDSAYLFEADDLLVKNGDIGAHLLGNVSFSNINIFRRLVANNNKYPLVLDNVLNTNFENTTVDTNENGILIDSKSKNVIFDPLWLELNGSFNIAYGTINENTLALTLSDRTNPNVTFKNVRWSPGGDSSWIDKATSRYLFKENVAFQGDYPEQSDLDKILPAGLIYKNIVSNAIGIEMKAGGTESIQYLDTPFGKKSIMAVRGTTPGTGFAAKAAFTDAKAGNTYLFKFKAKTSRPITFWTSFSGIETRVDSISGGWISGIGWKEFAAIIRFKETSGAPKPTDCFYISAGDQYYDTTKVTPPPIDMDFCDPAVYNLTEIFGKGREPDAGLNDVIGPYFTFVEPGKRGRTGSHELIETRKDRVVLPLQNGWTGEAGYRYLGNGMTEVFGKALGTGTIDNYGKTLFVLPPEFRPYNTSVFVARVANAGATNHLLTISVSANGNVDAVSMPGMTVAENNASASVQFNFIVNSASY